jgi:phage recombination protein Bet
MTNAIAKRNETAIGRFTPEQYDIIRTTLCADATNAQFGLFIAVCNRTGLDPFAKQIYPVIRKTKNGPAMAIQIGIDGYRLIAERSRDYGGQDAPEWCGPDGTWTDVWLDDENPPAAARVRVYRNGHQVPTVGIAKYKEFVQYENEWGDRNGRREVIGKHPTQMWKDMPANQLAKCAEAQALRKAFPNELRDIQGDFEMEAATIDVTPSDARVTVEQPPIQQPRRRDVDEHGEIAHETPPHEAEPPMEVYEGDVLTAEEAAQEAKQAPLYGPEVYKAATDMAKGFGKSVQELYAALEIPPPATQKKLIDWANERGEDAMTEIVKRLQGASNG